YQPISVTLLRSAYYLRFRVQDRPGIIARLAQVLAYKGISVDAVLQIPSDNWRDLPFVITTQPTSEALIRQAVEEMATHDYLVESPLAMPMEESL
ncbi:MAG: ACT domain-containing protein, partial [Bryobacteraceae bacterium]